MEKTARKKSSNKFVQIVKLHKKKLVILAFLAIMIYIIYLVVRLIINPTDTVYVEMGQIQEEETATGYIIRDETVLKGEKYKNGIEQIKTEGEKVAKGDAIFRYYSNNEDELIKKIQELDAKIDEAMSEPDNPLTSDTRVLEEQIDKSINNMYNESDLTKITESKKEILNNMTRKAKQTGELSPAGSY